MRSLALVLSSLAARLVAGFVTVTNLSIVTRKWGRNSLRQIHIHETCETRCCRRGGKRIKRKLSLLRFGANQGHKRVICPRFHLHVMYADLPCNVAYLAVAGRPHELYTRRASLAIRASGGHATQSSNSHKLEQRHSGRECCTLTSLLLNTHVHALYREAQHKERHKRRRNSYWLLQMRRERYLVRDLEMLLSMALL